MTSIRSLPGNFYPLLKILTQVKSAPPLNSSSMPTMEKQKKKKCSSLEHETSFNAKQKSETSKKNETGTNAKQKSLDESSNGKCEKPGFFERKGHQLKQKLNVKSDSCDSGTKKAVPRKIGIFKEKCLEMPDDSNESISTISNPERSDFLGGRRGMTKQKNVELVELPDSLGPPEKASIKVVDTPDILGSKVTDVPDFLGPPEKFDSAPRSRSQSIEVMSVFGSCHLILSSGGGGGGELSGGHHET